MERSRFEVSSGVFVGLIVGVGDGEGVGFVVAVGDGEAVWVGCGVGFCVCVGVGVGFGVGCAAAITFTLIVVFDGLLVAPCSSKASRVIVYSAGLRFVVSQLYEPWA